MRPRSNKKRNAPYSIKRSVFARSANMLTKRGYCVVNDVPEMYYVTENLMVCPPLDGLESEEMFSMDSQYASLTECMPFASKLKMMAPADEEISSVHSLMLKRVSAYMNETHGSNYIVYNLFRDR